MDYRVYIDTHVVFERSNSGSYWQLLRT